jgi:hypothetical protein
MKFLSIIGALAIIAAVAAGVFFLGGFYSVAAVEDPWIVKKALETVRNASINRHATESPPPVIALDDKATIQAGARAFGTRGCTFCHGGPGVDWAKLTEGMQPGPPDLKDEVRDLTIMQVFWIIKNGINMTGMPSAAAANVPDQEIWAIAAFVKRLPDGVSAEDYKAWTAPPAAAAGDAPK